MNTFLVLQATYETIELGISIDDRLIDSHQIDKAKSSSLLATEIDKLLKDNQLAIHQLSAIVVNRGPAPFTTLRVVLATANGISFASGIPLIGVDGMRAFAQENDISKWPETAYLLNAFNQDVYYALQIPGHDLLIGCSSIDETLEKIKEFNQPQWRFLGNGAALHKEKILTNFNNSYFPEPLGHYTTLMAIAKAAYGNQTLTTQLLPLYLKETIYRPSIKQRTA